MSNNNKNSLLKLRYLAYLLLLATCVRLEGSTVSAQDAQEPVSVPAVQTTHTQLLAIVHHAATPEETDSSEIDKESDASAAANAAANAAAAAAAVAPAPTQPVLTTTTPAPLQEEKLPLPEYLKNCFYAEEELCLNWFNTSDIDNATLTANNGSAMASVAVAATSASTSATANGSASVDAATQLTANNSHNRDINSCQCRPHPTKPNSWYCCNITHISMISSCSNILNWTNLHIRNATMTQMDLSNAIYRSLQSLAITDGNISQLVNYFPRLSSMKCLNISNNNITDISLRAVKDAPHLEFLDISNNSLSRMPNLNPSKNITMDISGNMRMLCEPLNDYIYSDTFKFVNPEKSFCLYNSTHQWFNSTDLVCIKQLERTKQCRTKCPVIENFGNCTCSHDQIMIIQGEESKPICHVDCSNLGLVTLPQTLPDNTFTLNITNNKITSLGDHFHANPSYHNIVKLMADNNQISSIYEFEGTKFIEQFQRIYMRNNSLSKIPEYFLNNALMDTQIGRRIYLAGNKLQCDCNSAKTLQNWLKERSSDIPDYMDIKCRNLPQSVIQLQETKLCQAPPDWTDYIYYLIAAEVFLLLALITKVSYDYWVFKTAGYLPWPASKMPKLPCDWLCES